MNQKNYNVYVMPEIIKKNENYNNYNVGDVIEYSNNGIDRWIVSRIEKWNSTLTLIPEKPVKLEINSADDDISLITEQIIESFNDPDNGVESINAHDINDLQKLIPDFLNQQSEKIYFVIHSVNWNKKGNRIVYNKGNPSYYYENGTFKNIEYNDIIYIDYTIPIKLGYRPVVTLKVKKEIQETDKKEISSKLQVGDNVKYEAKGYKNWKVLSIDNDLGTVDIISGGIVKNITLSGKEDWDNYEDIIQREVDEYKNGEQSKKATTVTSSHLKTLKEIDNKSILSRYWLLHKEVYRINKNYPVNYDEQSYNVKTVNIYKNDHLEIIIDNITLFFSYKGFNQDAEVYLTQNKYDPNVFTYTAGLRPVITLKLDSVEKLPEEETKKIEESTEKQEKVFIKEQESKNKNYKGPSKVDDSTSSTGNNEVKTNDNGNTKDNITDNNTSNVEKIVYKDKPSTRYQLIIQYIIIVLQLGVIIYLLLKRKNN